MSLERKTEKYVGNAAYVIAEGYTFKNHSTTYAIYNDDIVVGLVTVSHKPLKDSRYSFTNMFIADNYQENGYAGETVAKIIEIIKLYKSAKNIEIQVHENNEIALHIYRKTGFNEIGRADWNNKFIILSMQL